MFTQRFGPSFGYGRPPFGYGPRRGPWGHRHRRGGGILPLLAAAFIARAMMQRGYGRHGEGEHGRRHWGRGAWGEDRRRGDWGDDWGRGHWRRGGPWGRGGWGRGRGDYDDVRAAFRSLRSEAGPIVGLIRDAMRSGRPDQRQIEEIKVVLRDARQRIAAILAESSQSFV